MLLTWENGTCGGSDFSWGESTFKVNGTGRYPRDVVDTAKVPVVGQAGGVLLTETVRVSGLTAALSTALAPWAKDGAIHEPGKVLTDLAITLALGGDTLSDLGVLRGEPGVY